MSDAQLTAAFAEVERLRGALDRLSHQTSVDIVRAGRLWAGKRMTDMQDALIQLRAELRAARTSLQKRNTEDRRTPRIMTESQQSLVDFAATRKSFFPRRGQHAIAKRLVRMGYLKQAGMGVDEDDHTHDVLLYSITALGRKVAALGNCNPTLTVSAR